MVVDRLDDSRMSGRATASPLAVTDIGDGPAVVLIAGFGLDHRIWDAQAASLIATRRAVCVDLLGTGASAAPATGYDLEAQADLVVAALDEHGIDEFVVVGHSFGGMVAFNIAARYPARVEKLILVGSNAVRAGRSDDFPFGSDGPRMLDRLIAVERTDRIAGRRGVLTAGFATAPNDALLDFVTGVFLDMPSWAAIATYKGMYAADQTELIDRVRVPVLQIVGAVDRVHPPGGARWLQERLKGGSLEVIPDAGHYLMFERPEALTEFLLRAVEDTK
jgi:pimeloyl-ACP methyl ester carboxylesterase